MFTAKNILKFFWKSNFCCPSIHRALDERRHNICLGKLFCSYLIIFPF